MKSIPIFTMSALLMSGCALTHEQVVERAHHKTNTELCMALIQFPQYADTVEAELDARGHACDMQLAAAQVREQNAQNDRRRAAIQAATASFDAAPACQMQQPKAAAAAVPLQLAPASTSATAYFTGQQRQIQTVTYQSGWSCEYRYINQTFWRTFVGTCPSSVQVQ